MDRKFELMEKLTWEYNENQEDDTQPEVTFDEWLNRAANAGDVEAEELRIILRSES
jgi:hypothetical protein